MYNYFREYFIPFFVADILKLFVKLFEYAAAHLDVFIYVREKFIGFKVKRRDETICNIGKLLNKNKREKFKNKIIQIRRRTLKIYFLFEKFLSQILVLRRDQLAIISIPLFDYITSPCCLNPTKKNIFLISSLYIANIDSKYANFKLYIFKSGNLPGSTQIFVML